MTTLDVYQAIAKITGEMAKEGISKDRKNVQQGYAFRGIDDVYAAIAPKLAVHGLCILPRVISRDVIERTNAKGTALFYTTLTVEFDFVSSLDGSKHTVCTVGEAMDSGDKSANKAMSAAYKYAAFQTFCIPTEGDNDEDSQTHTVAAKAKPETKPEPLPEYPVEQFNENMAGWLARINSNKQTADQIINMISTKYQLSDVQRQSIKNMGEKQNANA